MHSCHLSKQHLNEFKKLNILFQLRLNHITVILQILFVCFYVIFIKKQWGIKHDYNEKIIQVL